MGNREALLEAAVVCLRERGYGSTTARDLATTAGVSLGAIRYHFGSTDGLLTEAIGECGNRWIAGLRASLSSPSTDDPAAGMLGAVDALYDVFAAERPVFVGFVEAFARAQRSAKARGQLAGHYDEFRRGLVAALRAALGQDRDEEALASILIAVVDGLMIQWLLDPERRVDPATLRGAFIGLVASRRTG